MTITLNGHAVAPLQGGSTLAAALRDRSLLSVKIGCDTGECGACLMLVDGVATHSCRLRTEDVGGSATLLTVEGISIPGEELHPVQQAFLDHGAVQCGFCTPALVLAAKELFDSDPHPEEREIRRSLSRVLCRCTGYQKPVEALLELSRQSMHAARETNDRTEDHRVDGQGLVRGTLPFTDDQHPAGMLYGKILWSPHSHALIQSIDTSEAVALPGVHAVLTWQNTPRVAFTRACQEPPEPSPRDSFLFDRKVRYIGDRVAAVAAESEAVAERALSLIEVVYTPLPAIHDYRVSTDPPASVIHDEEQAEGIADAERNLCSQHAASIGDSAGGLASADGVLVRRYETQRVQHAQLETHGAITWLDENGRLIVRSGTQTTFHLRRHLARILERSEDSIRVLRPAIGGGFGSRQEVIVEDVCSALTLASGRPVRIVLSRREEFTSTRCRHAMTIDLRTGYLRNGQLTAQDMGVLCDAGAYGSHSPTVCTNTATKNLPRYPCPNVEVRLRSVYTNTVVGGAFRGYGGPQGAFALESQIDELATLLGKDPVAYRMEIGRRKGDRDRLSPQLHGPREAFEDGWPALRFDPLRCLRVGADQIGWYQRRRELDDWNRSDGPTWRGLGVAFVSHGSGVAGHQRLAARLRLESDGTFTLSAESGELGTGSNTALIRLTAHSLGIADSQVHLATGDTDSVPYSSGTYASATTFLSAMAIESAARELLAAMAQVAATIVGVPADKLVANDLGFTAEGRTSSFADIAALRSEQGLEPFEIESVGSCQDSPPPFAAQFAEVEIDRTTFDIRVTSFLSVVDAGRIVNRQMAEGQVDGAVAQGIGFALSEEMILRDGALENPTFGGCGMFRADQLPSIETVLLDPEPGGDDRIRSIGEVGIDGPAPAIANAIFHATGVRVRRLPIRPADLRRAIAARDSTQGESCP